MLGVVIPEGTEFDVLRSFVAGEYHFQAFVKLLGKCRQVLWSIELRFLQFFWRGSVGNETDG
jgi:hypothetical protein